MRAPSLGGISAYSQWGQSVSTSERLRVRSSSLLSSIWLAGLLMVIQSVTFTYAYPVILALEGGEHRCLEFSIPEDDDAHVVMLPLPDETMFEQSEDYGKVELFYVEQVYKMTKAKSRTHVIPKGIVDDPPDIVVKAVSHSLSKHGKTMKGPGNKAPVIVTISAESYDEHVDEKNYKDKMRFFTPFVLNHVRSRHATQAAENYEGVEICFEIDDHIFGDDYDHLVHLIFDIVMVSEDVTDLDPPTGFGKEEHLTPLEMSLDGSIAAARQVLKEYKYMEQREARMRQTADGINARVHYFSYISVAILFGVTYLQVGYLKRYFKKKKLM